MLVLALFFPAAVHSQSLDTIGVTRVARGDDERERRGHPRGAAGGGLCIRSQIGRSTPARSARSTGFFTYISAAGSTTNFPNSLSSDRATRTQWEDIFTEFPVAWPRMSRMWTIMTRTIFAGQRIRHAAFHELHCVAARLQHW